MLENGINIRVVQELMVHANIKTTEIYTHVMEKHIATICSPLDILQKNVLEEKKPTLSSSDQKLSESSSALSRSTMSLSSGSLPKGSSVARNDMIATW